MYKPEERYDVDDVRFYRTMKKDVDGLPRVEQSKKGLGVVAEGDIGSARPDVAPDADGRVHPGKGGMSVAPHWRQLPSHRIPERLSQVVADAQSPNTLHCFRFSNGRWRESALSEDLQLTIDAPAHGTLEPTRLLLLNIYRKRLAETRGAWIVDEDL